MKRRISIALLFALIVSLLPFQETLVFGESSSLTVAGEKNFQQAKIVEFGIGNTNIDLDS